MKFAHLADCHIGSWRDQKLKDISTRAFVKAVNMCIENSVDFILIAGDLFNTSFPRLDNLKVVVGKLKQLNDLQIPVYIVPGSHDYSPSGRTILEVLEEAGLFVNVFKGTIENSRLRLNFTVDKKTGAKIAGMLGRRGALEKSYYKNLDTAHLEKEDGYKIFLFHSAIDELKPRGMENLISQPLSLLPKNFNYYAGGHVHIVEEKSIEGYGRIVYPGPLFPNSFAELEKLEGGGFYIVEDEKLQWEPVQIYNVYKMHVKSEHSTPEKITNEILAKIKAQEFNNTIVLMRVTGILESGKPTDIEFGKIFTELYNRSAYFVMKSTSLLKTKEFEEIKVKTGSAEDIEETLIKDHIGQLRISSMDGTIEGGMDEAKEEELIKNLIKVLSSEKDEGERNIDFERRVREELRSVLGMVSL